MNFWPESVNWGSQYPIQNFFRGKNELICPHIWTFYQRHIGNWPCFLPKPVLTVQSRQLKQNKNKLRVSVSNSSFGSEAKMNWFVPHIFWIFYQFSGSLSLTLGHMKTLDALFSILAWYGPFWLWKWSKGRRKVSNIGVHWLKRDFTIISHKCRCSCYPLPLYVHKSEFLDKMLSANP